jgi:aspartyl-tRNA(Asn)/glutamyl-tRNA(Gln) amidotransferase subunit C
MTVTQEKIKSISYKLGKLRPRNEEKLISNVSSILEYVDLLNEVDTTGVIPTVSVISSENLLKEDIEKRNIQPKDLLACSPQKVIANQIAISDIMK